MQHVPSDIKIFQTKEYERFRMINGNRALNLRKIDKIIKDINAGNDMLRYKPVEVRENDGHLDILDGQHRMYISKKMKRPVYYIVVEEDKKMNEIATINSNVDKWNGSDFINCYISQGNVNYSILKEYISTYKFSIGTSIFILQMGYPVGGGSHSYLFENFTKGLFEVKHHDAGIELGELCKKFSQSKFFTSRDFICALYKIKNARKIDMTEFETSVLKNIDKIEFQKSTKNYIYNLEQIVNIGKQKRIVII